jgi:hypothetical protein
MRESLPKREKLATQPVERTDDLELCRALRARPARTPEIMHFSEGELTRARVSRRAVFSFYAPRPLFVPTVVAYATIGDGLALPLPSILEPAAIATLSHHRARSRVRGWLPTDSETRPMMAFRPPLLGGNDPRGR